MQTGRIASHYSENTALIQPGIPPRSLKETVMEMSTRARAIKAHVPEQAVQLAVFLGSDESCYIHGDLIRVDGGETLCRFSV
jgi:hypothetical protein